MLFSLTVFDPFCWRVSPSSPSGRLARRWALRWITTLGLRRWGWQGWFVPGAWRKADENGLKHLKSQKVFMPKQNAHFCAKNCSYHPPGLFFHRHSLHIEISEIWYYASSSSSSYLLLEAIKVDEAIYRAAHERFSELLQRPGTLNSLKSHHTLAVGPPVDEVKPFIFNHRCGWFR